jgi:simple sugar transport system ATP-binding protein
MHSVTPRLELQAIRKVYPSIVANDGVNLRVMPGEIHAVLGENGAGKSTLMKIIYGVTQATEGRIVWEGKPVRIASPAVARSLGIGMVFQHFSLFETLTVAENITLGLGDGSPIAELSSRIESVSNRYGLPVDPRRRVHALSVGERQRVEIVRCLLQAPRLLIMDEPTSVLTPQAVTTLFDTLRTIAAEGCSILYISHKLEEIRSLCHSATVLRGGRVTGHCEPARETPASLAQMMIGRELPVAKHARARADGEVRLRLNSLSLPAQEAFGAALSNLDLEVRAGEIVGIAGISGNGQRELLRVLGGEILAPSASQLELMGTPAGWLGVAARRSLGLGVVPEERLGRGAVPGLALTENALLTAHRQGMVRHGLIDFSALTGFTQRCIDAFSVKCAGPQAMASSLSGGNVQRFIVGREILQEPRVLVVAQPTWGVDVGAAAFLRQALVDLRDRGCAILLISEELEELFEISDRIAVIAGGRLSPQRITGQTHVDEIGLWMSGIGMPAPHAEGLAA